MTGQNKNPGWSDEQTLTKGGENMKIRGRPKQVLFRDIFPPQIHADLFTQRLHFPWYRQQTTSNVFPNVCAICV